MLTNKGKYGLKAMVHLAGLKPDQPAMAADIAEQNNIPKKFLDAILAELRNAGVVRSKKGRGGGYTLSRPATEIKIGQIVRTLDGPLAPIRCASPNYYEQCLDCEIEKHCPVHLLMFEVRNAMARILDNRSLAEFRLLPGAQLERLPGTPGASGHSPRAKKQGPAKPGVATKVSSKVKPLASKKSNGRLTDPASIRGRAV